ncbi:hypothetical protein ACFLSA_05930 [Bacteroidota bacterium]
MTIKQYYEVKEYGDKQAVRFEHNARPLLSYVMPCIELTFPYTTLTWIMHDFIVDYYLKNKEGFENDTDEFWDNAQNAPMYQYEVRVNHNTPEICKYYCKNVVDIYKRIEKEGFNLAKPIPVTENRKGEIVAVKGAKRIAALMAHGIDWVPVLEYDNNTLTKIKGSQKLTSCIDHAELIFSNLIDLPYVSELQKKYQNSEVFKPLSIKKQVNEKLDKLLMKWRREKHYKRLLTKGAEIYKLIESVNNIHYGTIGIIIENEIEIVRWLYNRNVKTRFFISNNEILRDIKSFKLDEQIDLIDISEEKVVYANEMKCAEIWHSKNISSGIRIENIENTLIKSF